MTKAITIRADERTLDQLEELARSTERSRNFLANQALKEYLERHSTEGRAPQVAAPKAVRLEDYRSAFWNEDDSDDFINYLEEERQRSLQAGGFREVE